MKKIKNGKWRRQERQEEAVERNEAYRALSDAEKAKRNAEWIERRATEEAVDAKWVHY